jgi:small basic protein
MLFRLMVLIGAIILVVLGVTGEQSHGEKFWTFIAVGVLVAGSIAWGALRAWKDWRRLARSGRNQTEPLQ